MLNVVHTVVAAIQLFDATLTVPSHVILLLLVCLLHFSLPIYILFYKWFVFHWPASGLLSTANLFLLNT